MYICSELDAPNIEGQVKEFGKAVARRVEAGRGD